MPFWRIIFMLGLLYGAWIGADEVFIQITSSGEPAEFGIEALEAGGAAPGRWVKVTGATAYPTAIELRENGKVTARLIAYYSIERYVSAYDFMGERTSAGEAPAAHLVVTVGPDADREALSSFEGVVLQGTTARMDENLAEEDVAEFERLGVAIAEDAVLLRHGTDPAPLGAGLTMIGLCLAGAVGIGYTLLPKGELE